MATSLKERTRLFFPWMPDNLVDVYVDAFVEFGENTQLAMQEVRNGKGRAVYDSVFPGIRREDGTLRMSEGEYLSTKQSYRNSLALRGLNPALFETRLTDLVIGEVSPDEFEGRIAAVNENINLRGAAFRQAFAEASGLTDFSEEAVLATVLDPEGVGRELLERRLAVGQVRGSAIEQGVDRTLERARFLVERGIDTRQVLAFDRAVSGQVRNLQTIEAAAEGTRTTSVGDLEGALLLQEQEQVDRLARLLAREKSSFTSRRGLVSQDQSGAFTGLSAP